MCIRMWCLMFRVGVVLSGCFLAEEITGRLVQDAADTAGGENGSNALGIWKRVGSIPPPWRTSSKSSEGMTGRAETEPD